MSESGTRAINDTAARWQREEACIVGNGVEVSYKRRSIAKDISVVNAIYDLIFNLVEYE